MLYYCSRDSMKSSKHYSLFDYGGRHEHTKTVLWNELHIEIVF